MHFTLIETLDEFRKLHRNLSLVFVYSPSSKKCVEFKPVFEEAVVRFGSKTEFMAVNIEKASTDLIEYLGPDTRIPEILIIPRMAHIITVYEGDFSLESIGDAIYEVYIGESVEDRMIEDEVEAEMETEKRASPKRASPKRASPKRASPKRASPKRASPKRASPKRASGKRGKK